MKTDAGDFWIRYTGHGPIRPSRTLKSRVYAKSRMGANDTNNIIRVLHIVVDNMSLMNDTQKSQNRVLEVLMDDVMRRQDRGI